MSILVYKLTIFLELDLTLHLKKNTKKDNIKCKLTQIKKVKGFCFFQFSLFTNAFKLSLNRVKVSQELFKNNRKTFFFKCIYV